MISVQVVGHHSRGGMGEALARKLGGTAHIDDGTLGEWRNHMRAFRAAHESGAEHACILQEDAVPVPSFLEVLPRAIEQRPDDLISLYIGGGRPANAAIPRNLGAGAALGWAWAESLHLLWGVGVVLPTERIPDLLNYKVEHLEPGKPGYYDNHLGLWWGKRTGRKVQYVWPSLIDHNDSDSVISQRPQPPRKAFRVGTLANYDTPSFMLL